MTAREVRTSDQERLTEIWCEAFGDPREFVDGFFATAYSPNRALAVECDGQIASALYWLDCERDDGGRVAYIYAVATAKAYRGRGCFRLLMEKTHERLKQGGYEGAILVPADESLWRAYERMGYQACTYLRRETATAEGTCEIIRITVDEYETLRRTYLPQGGLRQERESMDFLALQLDFYRGEGFILAARREGKTLVCKEILGSIPRAQAITAALGAEIGIFDRAGDESDAPRAAYLAWNGDPAPRYLGFAFD